MNVNDRIKMLREELGIEQKALAKKLGISTSVMNRIELGTRPIRDEELSKLADIFSVSVDYLLCRTNIRDLQENTLAAHMDNRTKELSEDGLKQLDNFIDFLIAQEKRKR